MSHTLAATSLAVAMLAVMGCRDAGDARKSAPEDGPNPIGDTSDLSSLPPHVLAALAGPPPDATTTESGLAYKLLKKSDLIDRRRPTATSEVLMRYTGWHNNGTVFRSSGIEIDGSPERFQLSPVSPNWSERLQLMTEGDSAMFWTRGGLLVFEVELLEVIPPELITPEDTAPEVPAPEVPAPEDTVPELTAPEVTAPEVTAPKDIAPKDIALVELEPFVLPGYAVLDYARGDLNRDERKTDVVLALRRVDELGWQLESEEEPPRPLLLLVRGENGGLHLAGRDDAVVMCRTCGGVFGDPLEGIVIEDGYFSVKHYGGAATRFFQWVTFHWDGSGGWTLHKIRAGSFHISNSEEVDERVKTKADFGEVPFGQYPADTLD